jgi:hypothetical protein
MARAHVDLARLRYIEAKAKGSADPIAVVAHASAGAGYQILAQASGRADGVLGVFGLSASNLRDAAGAWQIPALVETLGRLGKEVDLLAEFVMFVLAWDGWLMVRPDQPDGWDPLTYTRAPEEPAPSASGTGSGADPRMLN